MSYKTKYQLEYAICDHAYNWKESNLQRDIVLYNRILCYQPVRPLVFF